MFDNNFSSGIIWLLILLKSKIVLFLLKRNNFFTLPLFKKIGNQSLEKYFQLIIVSILTFLIVNQKL